MVNEAAGAEKESVEPVSGIETLDAVKDTADDIVAARSLTAGKDYADIHRCVCLLLTGHELHQGETVGVGKEFLHFFLVSHALSGLTLLDTYVALQSERKLGAVGSSCNL